MTMKTSKWGGNWVLSTGLLAFVALVVYVMVSNIRTSGNVLKTSKFVEDESLKERQDTSNQNAKTLTSGTEITTSRSEIDYGKLCQEDLARIQDVLNFDTERATANSITAILAKTVTYPVQMGCKMMKRIGLGSWSGKCNDGHKYVCLDDIDPSDCLVYSFGLANQISFEESMASMGCKVFGYDSAKTRVMKQNTNPKLTFQSAKIGVGGIHLAELLIQNGHVNAPITYLKADIEGSELFALPIWIKSGALTHIKQLGFEFHSVDTNAVEFWIIIQDLYRLGFRIISYDPNFCMANSENGFYKLFEIVFRKTDVCSK